MDKMNYLIRITIIFTAIYKGGITLLCKPILQDTFLVFSCCNQTYDSSSRNNHPVCQPPTGKDTGAECTVDRVAGNGRKLGMPTPGSADCSRRDVEWKVFGGEGTGAGVESRVVPTKYRNFSLELPEKPRHVSTEITWVENFPSTPPPREKVSGRGAGLFRFPRTFEGRGCVLKNTC